MESSNTNNMSENTNNKDYLIKHEQIEETPFTITTVEGVHFGLIGNARITEGYDDKEKLREEIQKITWNRLTQVIWILAEKLIENKKTNE